MIKVVFFFYSEQILFLVAAFALLAIFIHSAASVENVGDFFTRGGRRRRK
jgi:hypothetical protein